VTLIEALSSIIANIDFTNVSSLEVLSCGLIFNKLTPSSIDALASYFASQNRWSDVCKVKRLAELMGYRSDQLDTITLQALDNIGKIGNLPANYTFDTSKFFKVDERCDLWLPKWAKEMGYRTDKWSADAIFQDLKKCYDIYNRPFSYVDPAQNVVMPDSASLIELYSMASQTLDCFIKLKAQGVEGALEYAVKAWEWINQNLWQTDHYKGKVSPDILEGALNFHLLALRLNAESKLSNFERLLSDVNKKLLVDRWASPLWSNYAVIVSYPNDTTPYLVHTINAFIMLHTIYPLLASDMKTSFASMLSVPTKAWEGLINNSGLYDSQTGKFKLMPTYPVSDSATALGCNLLLLQGIVPDTGSLAIPLVEDFKCDSTLMLNPRIFNLNLQDRKLVIPVFAGAIMFQFGDKLVSFDFETDGVWRLTFNSDWTAVIGAERLSDLPKDVKYVKAPTYPPSILQQFQALLNALIAFVMIFVILSMVSEIMGER
jgi:hypothetical protein